MKSYGKIIISYIIFMAVLLCVMLALFGRTGAEGGKIANYSDEELQIYKEVWSGINASLQERQQQLTVCIIILWAVLFACGLLFLFVIYRRELRPIREMQDLATEIAKGNLDVSLPVHKGSVYRSFTESFDLMREELKRSKQRELESEHAKRELVAELSHDLRTPVATIQATCEVLEMLCRKKLEAATDETQKKDLQSTLEKAEIIRSKAETISSLVQNVCNATLEDMDEVKVEVTECDSRRIEEYFTNLKDYGNIILTSHIPECLVNIDPLRMEQVVDNIVGNSYKYAGTDILVSFEEVTDIPAEKGSRKDFLRITVRDSGPGIPEDELPLISEKYYRGSNAKEKNGYGLGLYLVKRYMEKQGGGMEYYNDKGFVVELLVRKV